MCPGDGSPTGGRGKEVGGAADSTGRWAGKAGARLDEAPFEGFPNLVLTGFMGAGKTTVGREVARRLGREFVDVDAEIEARAGRSIPSIFAEDGEAAFRQLEAALIRELSQRANLVVATGGGALIDPANRAAMARSGTIVCLTCDVNGILRRITAQGDVRRPLLEVADPRIEIERLMRERQEAYAAIPWHIDTTELSVEEVADRVIALAEVVTLDVRHPEGEYSVHVGAGLLSCLGGALRATGAREKSRVAIVTDSVVGPLYGAVTEETLRSAGFQAFTCVIPSGERHKTLATVATLYDQFLVGELDRGDTVLALGGGVTGDIAGFAAATFMRGVRFVQVPTTILAIVDASVGGKTGVDLPQGKNLVGVFKQPALVLIDPSVLATLPEEERRSGMAEVLKHGVIGDADLFAALESGEKVCQTKAVVSGGPIPLSAGQFARAIRVKVEIVEQDPFEQGRRAILNLGHTVGHALEKLSNYSLRHGEAVAIGMAAASRIAVALGRAEPSLANRIEAALKTWGLPVRCPPFDVDAICEAMMHDKKRRGRSLRWVLPRAIGQVEIVDDVPLDVVRSVLKDQGASDKRPTEVSTPPGDLSRSLPG